MTHFLYSDTTVFYTRS